MWKSLLREGIQEISPYCGIMMGLYFSLFSTCTAAYNRR